MFKILSLNSVLSKVVALKTRGWAWQYSVNTLNRVLPNKVGKLTLPVGNFYIKPTQHRAIPRKKVSQIYNLHIFFVYHNSTICLFTDDFTEKSKQDSSTASSQDSEKSKHVDSGLDSTLSFTNKSDDKDSVYESEMGKKNKNICTVGQKI